MFLQTSYQAMEHLQASSCFKIMETPSISEKDEEELHKFAHTNSPLQKFKLYIHSNLLIIVHEYLKVPKL